MKTECKDTSAKHQLAYFLGRLQKYVMCLFGCKTTISRVIG